jgi:hypothetical protein
MSIETLGEAWRAGWRLDMRCAQGPTNSMKRIRECHFRRPLDMVTLVCTRGEAFPLSLLASRLRCPECGSRRVAVLFQPPGNSRQAAAGRIT